MKLVLRLLSVFLVQGLWLVQAYPDGAPAGTCAEAGYPRHGVAPQTSTSPYKIDVSSTTYTPGGTIQVTMTSNSNKEFEGFVLLASRASGNIEEPLGSFTNVPSQAKTLSWYVNQDAASPQDNCVTHKEEDDFTSLIFTWKAPGKGYGTLVFRATFLKGYETFWTNVTSQQITTTAPDESEVYNAEFQTDAMTPVMVDDTVCGETKGCFRYPSDCSGDDCEFAVTYSKNGASYDFQVMGNGNDYVAVGFSTNQKMGDDETITCIADDTVQAFHRGFNSGENNYRYIKTGLTNVYVKREDGRVYCSFTRPASMTVVDPETGKKDMEFNLADTEYYLQLAYGGVLGDWAKKHKTLPFTSKSKVDFNKKKIVSASLLPGSIKTHGFFGMLGWMTFASFGILLARHFRQELKSRFCGECVWLGMHRSFMINLVIDCLIAIIMIFVYKGEWTHNKSARTHAILGLVATGLAVWNLIGGFLRCKPDSPKRPKFNWGHRFLGISSWILGIATVFMGVRIDYLYKDFTDRETLILAVWLGLQFFWIILLEILSCFQKKRAGYDLKDGGKGMEIQEPEAKDSSEPIRVMKLICLAFYIATQLACCTAFAVFIYIDEY